MNTCCWEMTCSLYPTRAQVGSDVFEIVVGSKPTLTITSPKPGAKFKSGDLVMFAGSAADTSDGDVSGSIRWRTDFIHRDHSHPFGALVIGRAGSFRVPSTQSTQ